MRKEHFTQLEGDCLFGIYYLQDEKQLNGISSIIINVGYNKER
jgi:hypothetical protein